MVDRKHVAAARLRLSQYRSRALAALLEADPNLGLIELGDALVPQQQNKPRQLLHRISKSL